LYRLPEVLQAVAAGTTIYVPEGERDVETLRSLGLIATCNPMGVGKWRATYSATLRGAHVAILPDNDPPGRQHAEQVAQALYGVAASLKVVALPGLPEKGDVSDWMHAGGTVDALHALITATPPWQPAFADAHTRQNGPAQPLSAQKILKVTQLSTVTPERLEFLWTPFIPKGRPVALEGDPGVGKSSLVAKLVAHLTTGTAFPNVLEGTPPPKDFSPCNVCLLTSEDDPADTLVPRIAANGGDVQRVFLIEVGAARRGQRRRHAAGQRTPAAGPGGLYPGADGL
jgi:putative DNA primase/helicase